MTDLVRLSLSIEKTLYDRLEKLVREAGYSNRSEFVRDMIRDRLVEKEWKSDETIIGSITIIFDHCARNLNEMLMKVQQSGQDEILACTHVPLTSKVCAQVILVKGKAAGVRDLMNTLRQQKGVLHAGLSSSTLGDELS